MFDVEFYRLLTMADTAILHNSASQNELKQILEVSESEGIRDELAEAYLAGVYAIELRNELSTMLHKVKLLSTFIEGTVEDEVFNRLYEESEFED